MRNFRSSSSAAPPALRSARPRTRRTRRNPIPPIRRLSRSLGGRTSVYRGVTRHIWTGKYEAHIWDKQTWNHLKNRKGRQGVYLGAFEDEEAAAHVHDLAALKFYGPDTVLNFPANTYKKDFEEMKNLGREEFLVALKRKSSGFARGESKYRGVARHQQNGRWEARIGRLLGNRNPYLGTYETEEEAAAAYDLAAIQHRGLNAVTNFHISNYIKNDEIHQLQQLPQQEQQEQAMNAATDFDITNFIGNAPVQPLQQQEQAMNTAVNNFNIHHYMENAQVQPLLHQQGQAMNAAVNNFYIGQYTENAQVEALKQMQQEQEEQQATLQFTELQQEIAQLQINNQELPNPVNHHQPLVIDPVEEQPWRVSMDSEFNPFLAPDVGLEGSSELPGLFNDASFEENIEIFFGEEGNGNSLDGIYEN